MNTKPVFVLTLIFLALSFAAISCKKNSSDPKPVTPTIVAPTGAINGIYSLSDTLKVYFSQGNLQYQNSTHTWKFAENQYDFIGDANSSSNNIQWKDLFLWGHTVDTLDSWRRLSKDEWEYVFERRNTNSGILFAKANVNNINGIILFPDDWNADYYDVNETNLGYAYYDSNVIDSTDWKTKLEAKGAVFLPAAGCMSSGEVHSSGGIGYYWSSTYYNDPIYPNSKFAYFVMFETGYISPVQHALTQLRCALRLVYPI